MTIELEKRFSFDLTVEWHPVKRRFPQALERKPPQDYSVTVNAKDLATASTIVYAVLGIDPDELERRSVKGDSSYWGPRIIVRDVQQIRSVRVQP